MTRVVTMILNWNRCADTLACLASVHAMKHPTEVIVIDNGSTDASVAAIRHAYPGVTILETGANLGYAAGNNAGFDHIRARPDVDAILVLNNDTIAEPEMLTQLVAEYEATRGEAVIGPQVRYADAPRTIWCAGGSIDWWRGYTTNIAIGTEAPQPAGSPVDVPFVVGCAMLIPITAIRRIGGFDPRYYMYWEEVDWCVRARKAGHHARIVPSAVLYHKVSRGDERPSPRVLYYLTRNRLLLLRTHLPWHRQPIALAWTLWGQLRTAINLSRARDWRRHRALMRGLWDGAVGRVGESRLIW